jgi:hypothetical protein
MKQLNDFQERVGRWMLTCFNIDKARNVNERKHRFLEESLELVQALGTSREEALVLVEYVFSRPVGEAHQEAGGALVTLAALCNAVRLNLGNCGMVEISRIERPEVIEIINNKNRPLND